MANLTRTGLGTVRDANFPTNNNNEITASDLRDWLTDGIDSFLTQKDKNVMEEVIWEGKSNNLTAGATTDLSLANGNFVHITGTTTTINSFGICDAGARFIIVFDGVYTLDYDATQLILPGSANITTANNDCCMIVSEGSGNWRVVGYFPIAGGGGGGGGVPGGADTEVQYNNAGTFGGIPELTYSGGFIEIKTPKIGTSNGNGHMHIHSANSAPTGITDYLTMFWQKATRALGFRSETDTYETYIQLTAPTADQTITIPDATGNVVIDTTVPSFSNGASAGEIRFKEAGGSNYVGLKAASSLSADTTFTLPTTDGTSGNVLQTNGAGVLSWVNNGGTTTLQYLKNTSLTTITNPAANTIIDTLLIPAGTFTSNNGFVINVKTTSSVTTTGYTGNININTSATIGGVNIQSGLVGAGVVGQNGAHGIQLYGGGAGHTTRYISNPWTGASNAGSTTTAIDWSVNQYVVVWATASATRTITNQLISTTPI